MALEKGAKLGHYEIIRQLGAGGMGEVHLAEDTRLRRKLALKVLPENIASDKERLRRFEQEAFAASALNHPNILTIYEFGREGDTHFLAAELVEGETLRERLNGERLSLDEALDIAQQTAFALSAAHSAGIAHRDIKPENIMIRADRIVKVLDFGLAKLSEPPAVAGGLNSEAETRALVQTNPGVVMGTVNYMSPEQAKGKDIDMRTDIWSLGVVLYETLTGRLPFEGDTPNEYIASILKSDPLPLEKKDGSVPAELAQIVRKALRKDKDARYQTMKGLLADLKELREEIALTEKLERSSIPNRIHQTENQETLLTKAETTDDAGRVQTASSAEYIVSEIKRHKLAALVALFLIVAGAIGLSLYFYARNTEVAIESIAVLPFENKSSDADTEYLSDGLAESLIYRLSQLPNLRVSPRSLVFRYKGKETDAIKVGSELNVNAVLSGRIMQRGDNLTISVELVDVRYNKLLWGEQYERKMSDLLQTQREIAREIVEKLKLKVTGEEKAIAKRYTENNEAYQLYLKGRFYYSKRNAEAFKKAIQYFNEAIEKDPNFALAFAGLSDVYTSMPVYSAGSPRENVPKATAAAKKALEIDETIAEAHTALGIQFFYYEWNLPESNKEFQRAFELNPNYATAHQWYGIWNLASTGRFDEAVVELKRAQELDPLSLIINTNLGESYVYARQYDKAIEQLRKTLELDQSFTRARWTLGVAYELKGSLPEAIAEYQKAGALDDDPRMLAMLGHAYATSGKRDEALKALDQLKNIARQRYVSPINFVFIYIGLGEKDEAFRWLETCYQERDPQMTRLKVNPLFDPLRSDPRFTELMRRVGLP